MILNYVCDTLFLKKGRTAGLGGGHSFLAGPLFTLFPCLAMKSVLSK